MEFQIKVAGTAVDCDVVQALLLDVDPVAVAALDRNGKLLRIAAETTTAELVDLLQRAGCPVAPPDVLEVPSFCCGSCSG